MQNSKKFKRRPITKYDQKTKNELCYNSNDSWFPIRRVVKLTTILFSKIKRLRNQQHMT